MAYGELMPRLSPCSDGLILGLTEKYRPAASSVIDIGCGRGERLKVFREAFPGIYTAGLDSDPDMAEAASEWGDVRLADAAELPFEAGSFDLALMECSLSLFPEPEKSLREAFRALKPGGILILGEIIAPLKENSIAAPDGKALGRIYSAAAIENMACEAGFAIKEFSDRRSDLAAMAAQMIMDGSFGCCLGQETAKLLAKLKAGYGLWVFGKEKL